MKRYPVLYELLSDINHARFHFGLIGGNLTAQLMESQKGIGGGIQVPEMYLQALLPFPTLLPECSGELARRLCKNSLA